MIIVDGLDECSSESTQCEIIRLIGEHARSSSALLWMVVSRPEWHIQEVLAQVDFSIHHVREKLTCNAADDAKDVYLVLVEGLAEIRHKYSWQFRSRQSGQSWPTENQVQRLAHSVSGLFVLCSTVLKFIGDEEIGDPELQLNLCLSFLGQKPATSALNPLHGLDLLYRHIMSRLSSPALAITKRIISFQIILDNVLWTNIPKPQTARDIFDFLCLGEAAFYKSLQKLHSVLDVPSPDLADSTPLVVFHKSFADFLEDSSRYAISLDQTHQEVAVLSRQWYNWGIQSQCKLECELYCVLAGFN